MKKINKKKDISLKFKKKNSKFYFIFLFFVLVSKTFFGQSNKMTGRILDAKTSKPVIYATIIFKNNNLGLYANKEGDFTINNSEKFKTDSLIISSIGYKKKSILFSDLKKGIINTIYLQSVNETLDEIIVKTRKKRIRAKKLIREAIKRIPNNYPSTPFSFVSYYREYLKRKGKYSNLNEGILQTLDSGFNSPHYYNKFRLLSYRKNKNFSRETFVPDEYDSIWQTPDYVSPEKFIPYAKILAQGGNELFILLAHDPIRNYSTNSFAFIYKFSKDFLTNHSFEKPLKVYQDNMLLYKIKFHARKIIRDAGTILNPKNKAPEFKAHYIINNLGEIETDAVLIEGEIFINPKDYTIHKIKYKGSLESTKNKIYELSLEYGYADNTKTLMRLKYISFNNEFFTIDHNDENYFKIIGSKRITNSHILLRTNAFVDPKNSKNKYFYDVFHQKKKLEIDKILIDERKIKIYLKDSKYINMSLSINVRNVRDIEGRVINQKKVVRFYQFRELFVQEYNKDLLFNKKCYLVNLPLSRNCISFVTKKEKYLMNSPLKQ